MGKEKTSAQKEAKALARAEYKAEGKRRAGIRKKKRAEKRRSDWKLKYRGYCPCCGRSRYGDVEWDY